MGRLILARHGQASFLSDDYDQLSPLGLHQAYRLGQFWAARNTHFDRVITGPLKRQRDTAAEVARAFEQASAALPKPEVMDAFAEYDGDAIMRLGLPKLLERDEQVRRLLAAFEDLGASADQAKQRHAAFQRVFELVLSAWAHGEVADPGLETWQAFSARVNTGLEQLVRASPAAATIVVFTSGGPIALAMQRALKLSIEATLQSSWMSRNASWSDFLFSGDRFTLSSFNVYEHLDSPNMLTYR